MTQKTTPNDAVKKRNIDILKCAANGESVSRLAWGFGLSRTHVSRILRKYGIAGASVMAGYNILDGMDEAQAKELKKIDGSGW